MSKMIKLIDRVSLLLLCLGVALPLAEIVKKYPDNQGEFLWCYGLLTAVGMIATIAFSAMKRRLVWRRCIFAVVFVLVAWCCDVFDILIPHETWIERGMPAWGMFRWSVPDHVLTGADEPRVRMTSPCGQYMLVAYHDSQTGVDDVILGELRGGRVLAEEHGVGLLEKLAVEWQRDNVVLWPGRVIPLVMGAVKNRGVHYPASTTFMGRKR